MTQRTMADVVQASIQSDHRVEKLRQELTGDLLTADQVAAILGLERTTVLRYLREHELVGFQLGRRWVTPESEVRAFLERQAEREREAARITKAEAEARRKYELWSETQPHRRWQVLRCHHCGHHSVLARDEYTVESPTEYHDETRAFIERSGTCEFCTTPIEAGLQSGRGLLREWAEWRRPEVEGNIDSWVQLSPLGGWDYYKCSCDYCGSPVLLKGRHPTEDETPDFDEVSLHGSCSICRKEIDLSRNAQSMFGMPF